MPMSSTFGRNKRGFTLLELVVVLLIVGSVLGAVWWAAGIAHESGKENDAVSELTTVVQNIETMMSGQSFTVCDAGGAPPCVITNKMIQAQAIPATYIDLSNNATADNAWGTGNFIVQAINAKTFRIIFQQVPIRGCIALLSRATACQQGQIGCPTAVSFGAAATNMQVPNAATGWQTVMTATQTANLCNSVGSWINFDYSL